MTQPDQALLARINSDVAVMWSYLGRITADLRELDHHVAQRPAAERVVTMPPAGAWAPQAPVPQPSAAKPNPPVGLPVPPTATPSRPVTAAPPRSDGWIGKALAVAGVAVTLVGVVLLLVLAAQAGLLRPEIRVGAGAVLAGALVAVGIRWNQRPGGRVGAIALSATGIAAAYIDVVAVTTIYHWAPGAVGLILAAAVGGAGLALARRWNSEPFALLVLVPLLLLGPIVVGGITLLLVGFMLVLSAVTLPVQLGRDWLGMHAARMAVATLPLLAALAVVDPGSGRAPWVAAASGIGALLALASAAVLLPTSTRPTAVALFSAAGVLPVLASSMAVDRPIAAVMAAALAVVLLALAATGDRLIAGSGRASAVWTASSAVSALVAITVGFDAPVAGPLLLATAFVVAVAARRDGVARWAAVGLGAVGGIYYLVAAPPANLASATEVSASTAVATLISSLLVIACAAAITWAWASRAGADRDATAATWIVAAVLATYAVTMFTVTAGVLFAGPESGFFAGHVAATIFWIGLAALVFRYAAGVPRAQRSLPIGAGMALVAAAMAKLFLFDLGALDGIFRVVVFIVAGLALLGMGAGYARLLTQQDERDQTQESA